MKTPEEIKKGLECCKLHDGYDDADCSQCPYTRTTGKCVFVMHDDALAYIQQLESKVPKWISVEERLPRNEELVLIATKWRSMGKCGMAVSCGFHTDGKTFTGNSAYNWNDGDVDFVYDEESDEYIVPKGWWEGVRYTEQFAAVDEPVTHWMPFPEPPVEV